MKKRNLIALIAVLVATAFLFVSCAAPTDKPEADAADEPAATEEVVDDAADEDAEVDADVDTDATDADEDADADADVDDMEQALPMSVQLRGTITEIRDGADVDATEVDADAVEEDADTADEDVDADAEVAEEDADVADEDVDATEEDAADAIADVLLQIRVEQTLAADEAEVAEEDAEATEEDADVAEEDAVEEDAEAVEEAEELTEEEIAAAEDLEGMIDELEAEEAYTDIIANITADTLVVDAETGQLVEISELAEGDEVVLYTSSVMTFSQPPISNAFALVVNLPEEADAAVPSFLIASEVTENEDGSVTVRNQNGDMEVTFDENTELTILDENNESKTITAADITEGTVLFFWADAVAESMPAQAIAQRAVVYTGERASWNLMDGLVVADMMDVFEAAAAADETAEEVDADEDADTDADADVEGTDVDADTDAEIEETDADAEQN